MMNHFMGGGVGWAMIQAYVALLIAGAVSDIRRYEIPNGVCLALALLFVPWAALAPTPVAWSSHIGAGALTLAGGWVLFHLGKLGGGDVKFLAATAIWAGFEQLPALLVWTALAGGALAIGLLLARRGVGTFAAGAGEEHGRTLHPRCLRQGEAVPYGLAIAISAIGTIFR